MSWKVMEFGELKRVRTLKIDVYTFFDVISHFLLAIFQNKFKDAPVVLITAEHLRTGKEYDAALIWTEDVTKDSFKVCLRELQNFDGKHEDISVVCTSKQSNTTNVSVKEDLRGERLFIYPPSVTWKMLGHYP